MTLCNRALRDAPPEGKALAKVQLAEAEVGLAKEELRLVPAGDEAVKLEKERALAEAKYELAKAEAVAAGRDPTTDALVGHAWQACEALLPTTGVKRLRREDGQKPGLGRFMRQVAEYSAKPDELAPHCVLHFTDTWFGKPESRAHELFVRDCYATMFSELELLSDPNYPTTSSGKGGVAVVGTPGIGKSGFGVYAVARFAQRRAVYFKYKRNAAYLVVMCDAALSDVRSTFPEVAEKGVYQLPDAWTLERVETIPNLVGVVDPERFKPVYVAVPFQLVVSSPDDAKLGDFMKGNTLRRIMPKWTKEEVLHLVPLHASEEDRRSPNKLAELRAAAEDAFDFFGGVPRSIFVENDKAREGVSEQIGAATLEGLIAALRAKDPAKGKLGAYLVHTLPVQGKPDACRREVASPAIGRRLVSTLIQRSTEHFENFFASTRNLPALQVLRGYALEHFAHFKLEKGGEFAVAELDNEDALETDFAKRVLPKLPIVNFEQKLMGDLVALAENQLAVPLIPNFEAFDSFAPLCLALLTGVAADTDLVCAGFQMTTSATHGIRGQGLKRVRDKVRVLVGKPQLSVCVVFITTSSGIRKRQQLTKKGGGNYSTRGLGVIRQFGVRLGDDFERLAKMWEDESGPLEAAAPVAGNDDEGDEEEVTDGEDEGEE